MPTVNERLQYLQEAHRNPLFSQSFWMTPKNPSTCEIHFDNTVVLIGLSKSKSDTMVNIVSPLNMTILQSRLDSDKEVKERGKEGFSNLSLRYHSVSKLCNEILFIGDSLSVAFSEEPGEEKIKLCFSGTVPLSDPGIRELTQYECDLYKDALIPQTEKIRRTHTVV